ncbi:hypothetical protein [Bacillus sp. ISL-7]|uniref:hypothetical protein n=1 Tax=Bacillus sp. ISL-7 TaxID=2819136 RepID=UPI001BE8EC81|nr:hypothetical protein [Bacillus sp. ISL-7]MBT2738821.1 hypothetical protein [Bacillus sp. ISL-7]
MTENQKTDDKKRKLIGRFIGDLQYILEINSKLGLLDKTLSITWVIIFVITLFMEPLLTPNYLLRVFPTLMLSLFCIIILLRKEFGLKRFIHLSLTILMMLLSQEWVDLPSYLKHEYKVVEGIPNRIEFNDSSKGRDYWEVVVRNIPFSMQKNSIKEEYSDRWFSIRYFPHTKFILDYKILSKEETRKKLQAFK